MKTTIRNPQAPAEPLPELAAFLEPFHVHFLRSEGRHALDRYLTGLLTELPNKNCDTIAASIPGTSEQQLQGLLSTTAWDQDDLNRQRVEQMLRLPSERDGVLIFDDTGFAKQGKCSVGVARQYSGTLGKKGNCQITVNCHYAERTVAWPVATRLYLPRHWAEDLPRRAKAHVPEEVCFQTKPQIALALLDQAKAWGVHSPVDRGRRLRRQPQLPGWLGEASQALRGRCPRQLRRGPVAARRADATGRCPGGARRPGRGAR